MRKLLAFAWLLAATAAHAGIFCPVDDACLQASDPGSHVVDVGASRLCGVGGSAVGCRTVGVLVPASGVQASPLADVTSYWKLEEATGASRVDSKGTNNLTSFGASGGVSQQVGKIGNAAGFSATNNQYLSVADNASFNTITNALSVQAWVYWTDFAGSRGIVSKWTYPNPGSWAVFVAGPDTYKISVAIATSASDSGTGCQFATGILPGPPAAGTWHHLVTVFDGTQTGDANRLKVYFDGVAQTLTATSGSVPATVRTSTAPLVIGNFDPVGLNWSWNGRLDEVALWNRAVTAADVVTLFNSGNGLPFP